MKIASTCVVVKASPPLGVELRLIAGAELVGALTVRHQDIPSLIERLQFAAAQVVAGRHADREPLELTSVR